MPRSEGSSRFPDGPPLSVVITVLNEGHAVDALLEALLPQLGLADEMVLVDGGSEDDTVTRLARWAERDGRIRVVSAPGSNIPRGRNAGVAAAANPLIACTDAGCVPAPDWLEELRGSFSSSDPPPDLVAGVYRVEAEGPMESAMQVAQYPDPAEALDEGLLVRLYGRLLGRTFDPVLPSTRSVAFTVEAWSAVGGFPEHLDTAEDPAFGLAVAASGRRCVLNPRAEVVWAQRPGLYPTARMFFRYGRGDALTGNRKLIGRNLARAAAYVVGPYLLLRGGRAARASVLAAAAVYMSLPVARLRGRRDALPVALLIPVALAVKDLAKAAGCLYGLAGTRTAVPERMLGPRGGKS